MTVNKTVSIEARSRQGFEIEVSTRQFFIGLLDQGLPTLGGTDAGPKSALEYLFFALGKLYSDDRADQSPTGKIDPWNPGEVDGDLNTMALMGKKTDDRSGFQEIRVAVDVDADMSREEKEKICAGC